MSETVSVGETASADSIQLPPQPALPRGTENMLVHGNLLITATSCLSVTPTYFFCGAFAERLKCIQEPQLDQKISTEDSGIWKHLKPSNLCPFSLIEISIKCAIKLISPRLCKTERISYHGRRSIQKCTQLPRVRRRFRLGSASL